MAEDISNKGDSIMSVANIVGNADNTGVQPLEETKAVNNEGINAASYNSASELVEHLNQQEDDASTNYLNNNNIATENNLYDDIKKYFDPIALAEDPGMMDEIKSIIGSQMDFGKDKLTPKEFFPDIDKPIKAGTYSGKIIGTHNVYVGEGMLLPLSIVQNRNLAQKEAAKKRMEIAKKVRAYASIDAPAALQDQMDDQKNAMIEKYMEKTNGNFHLLADPSNQFAKEFQKEREKLNSFNRNLWNATKRAEQTKKDITDPKKYVPDDIINSTMETIAGTLDVDKLLNSPTAREKWMKHEARNISWENMMKVVDDHLIDSAEKDKLPLLRDKYDLISTDKELQSHYKTIMTGGDYTHKASAYKTFVDTERIEAAVNAIFDNSNIYKGYTEKEKKKRKKDMLEYYTSKLGTQIETDLKSLNLKDSTSDDPNDPGKPSPSPLFTAYTEAWEKNKEETLNSANTGFTGMKSSTAVISEAGEKNALKSLSTGTGIEHSFDSKGRLVGKITKSGSEDEWVNKSVGEVKYNIDGQLMTPEEARNHIWANQGHTKTDNTKDWGKTYYAITGKNLSEGNGKDPVKTGNSAFDPEIKAGGIPHNFERVYQVKDEETGKYRDVTKNDLKADPNLLSSPNVKHIYRAYVTGYYDAEIKRKRIKSGVGSTKVKKQVKGQDVIQTGGYDAVFEADLSFSGQVNTFNEMVKSESGQWQKAQKSGAKIRR